MSGSSLFPPNASPSRLLKERAYEVLREKIVTGQLEPGDRVSERALSLELNMSKTPVKAALERLEEQGFVSISPQRRAVVRALTDKEVADHYDLRIALESFVAARATGNLSEEVIAALTRNLSAQRRITSGRVDLDAWVKADYEFHWTLVNAIGNQEIERILNVQRDRLYRLVASIARLDPAVPPISYREHVQIFDLVRVGRVSEAIKAVIAHLEHGRNFLLCGGRYGEKEHSERTS